MLDVGEKIAIGRTSEVFATGNDSVVKILRPDVPLRWAELEALVAGVVGELGLPAPEFRGLVDADGRPGLIFERVRGISMWQRILDDPNGANDVIAALGAVQRRIHQSNVPAGLPGLVQRLRTKIRDADSLSAEERDEGCAIAETLPKGAALLHGDLHPGNVLLVGDSPMVIDWFDASVGHPTADLVRSSMLLRPGLTESDTPHLPGATPDLLAQLYEAYNREFEVELSNQPDLLQTWEAVIAAGRMSEQAQRDESILLAMWSARP